MGQISLEFADCNLTTLECPDILSSEYHKMKPASALRMRGKKKRKSPDGIPANKLIFSAAQGTNDAIFPDILALYVRPGSTVADITYGKGVFWKSVPKDRYRLLVTDIKTGIDCRALPYEHGSLDSKILLYSTP